MSEGTNAARRTEDIALDLLKFIAAQTHVGTKAAGGGVGFGATASGKPEDQVKLDSDRDYYMTAEEAKAYGLVDEVVKSRKELKAPDAPPAAELPEKVEV